MDRILELDPEARTARVQPGVVQDQLNRAAAAHGLMFGPDTSTSNRATLGGMIGNNSAGSGSVRYGMTIDHVRELDVVLADASTARRSAPVDEAERARRAAGGHPGGPRCTGSCPRSSTRTGDAIATGFPPFWRRAGGYRLDRLARARSTSRSSSSAPRARSSSPPRRRSGWCPSRAHTVIAVGHFRSTQAAIAATEDALSCDPAAVELMDRTILDLSRQKIEYAALGSILHDDPDALLFVSFTGDDPAELAGALDRLDRAVGAARARLPHAARRDRRPSRRRCSRSARPASGC